MADFGKLDFATSFSPTSAFPLDARYIFDSFADANAAAATAEEAGSTNTKYYYGQQIAVVDETQAILYIIQPNKTLQQVGSVSGGTGTTYVIGNGLKLDTATNTLSVDCATAVEKDNTKPITSAAVHTEVGNINVLLETI